jgi:purine-nucleoside phosphorylase
MTNMAAGMEAEVLSHAHTMDTAKTASDKAVLVLTAVLQNLQLQASPSTQGAHT